MDKHPVTMLRFLITCRDNGHQTLTYGFGEFEYGRKEARTRIPDDLAYVDCSRDSVCHEVYSYVENILSKVGKKEWEMVRCNNAVFGYACDPAPSGLRYDFSGVPSCSVCGSSDVAYGPLIPEVSERVYLPHVTHHVWNRLSRSERHTLIRTALKEAKCLSP